MPGLLNRFLRRSVKAGKASGVVALRRPGLFARYDSAQTDHDNRRHWLNADAFSVAAGMTAAVRRTLRMRARYEVANNCYAAGVLSTLTNHTVGTGVRLQMGTPDGPANNQVEALFEEWELAIGLAAKLRTMRRSKAMDGEVFGMLVSNPGLPTAVKLDLRLIEGDQIAKPMTEDTVRSMSDGIEYDKAGNPTGYWLMKHHPGDLFTMGALEADLIPAKAMIHYFRADRPGQLRGIPEITPAIELFAQLRRYTDAVIAAAETAAEQAMVIETDAPPGEPADAIEGEAFEGVDLNKRMSTILPQGWKLSQMKPEQPTTGHWEFVKSKLGEIGRCLDMPFNVVACDSSSYNYASGRMDHQVYFRAIRVEQKFIEHVVLERVFAAWFQEAVLIEGYLPQSMRRTSSAKPVHQWFWDGQEHVDPEKEANAQAQRLIHHTTTLAEEFAKRGKDWEAEVRQMGAEAKLLAELGLEIPTQRAAAKPSGTPEPAPAGESAHA